ncbi:anthranilate phosphoribosyltransferase [Coemansia sp. RSA 1813]|nr:anthranilate phosphoribosyltransferase [Coemansia sp. RSA 1646]KAJ1766692.1 anthranilate phosphoribosyltransferase [Coemansia sp. RSA 1843]KAJ2085785.1 anthranilate phosphoribosyltransferase [Coemansia sp. RSA 986]KAJ2211915.1 anthranilate phosphoribosyltransferase [Coemansia sp. RSA 487]KAJ2563334.1 anthranilate phosphoribosyltransferase [Coemansia sp. RSA 1813]
MESTNNKKHLREILKHLILEPEGFTPEHAANGLHSIMRGEASDAQMGGFLTALKLRGVDKESKMIAALAREMLNNALIPHLETDNKNREQFGIVADIVGTGGDGWNTFNISTTSSLVAAAAGLQVAKHGSRASSSNCGSADLLESLGCDLGTVSPSDVAELLSKHRFCFLFSSTFHPSMRYLAKTRRELGFPTPFNVLGPLTNPVLPNRAVIGVHSKPLGPVMAEALKILGRRNYAVVCGDENLDEISIAGPTHVWHIQENGDITNYTIHPSDFGVPAHPLSDAAGSSPEENKATLIRLLSNSLEAKDEPIRDFVLVNTGFLLYISGMALSMKEGATIARDTLESGKVQTLLYDFAKSTQELRAQESEKNSLH